MGIQRLIEDAVVVPLGVVVGLWLWMVWVWCGGERGRKGEEKIVGEKVKKKVDSENEGE